MGCTPRMEQIAAGFEAAHGISESASPLLASGECFHLTEELSPTVTHYGVTLLDPHEGATYMGGIFSFFAPSNPYAKFTPEDVRKESTELYFPKHRIEFTPNFVYANMNPGGDTMWLYWLKRDREHLYVIGQWGTGHRVYCEMSFQ
jgi:hypothetical protein